LREILGALKSRHYQIEASVAESLAQDADKVMRRWLQRLGDEADGDVSDSDSDSDVTID
jgi:hypothetical protein